MTIASEEPFYRLMLDYLHQLPSTEKFVGAFTELDATHPAPPIIEDAPLPFIAKADWTALASEKSADLVAAFAKVRHDLPWHVPYSGDPLAGPGFSTGAASTGRIGPTAPVRSDVFASGFFAVGPGVDYFDHQHEPEELYLPIAGKAEFWSESLGWHEAGPDDLMVHPQWEWHAMKTGDQPILIFWAWLGPEGFGRLPDLRAAMGGVPQDVPAA
ncbi:MAG: dimethylsulfonioproprionate lyase family protein [Pseudomonadota bacterium]